MDNVGDLTLNVNSDHIINTLMTENRIARILYKSGAIRIAHHHSITFVII